MKFIKRVIAFVSIAAMYFIIREFLFLYNAVNTFHPTAGFVFLIFLILIFLYFIVIPIIKILTLPQFDGPTIEKSEEQRLIKKRIKIFRKNDYLEKIRFDFDSINDDSESYQKILEPLKTESKRIREKYIFNIFVSSSLAQNGFIDAILIMSLNIRVIKEIFILYGGRVTYRDIYNIGKNVYYSIAIGGSEAIEDITEELVGEMPQAAIGSIGKVVGSISDGFFNAVLLARVALITENYCTMVHINKKKDLYPKLKSLVSAVKAITKPLKTKIFDTLKGKTVDKSKETANKIFSILKSYEQDFEDFVEEHELKKRINIVDMLKKFIFRKST